MLDYPEAEDIIVMARCKRDLANVRLRERQAIALAVVAGVGFNRV